MLEQLICLHEPPLKLCVDANLGGHVIEFSLNGTNALATDTPAIGSTFWPSPQQAWDWPPPPALDNAPYKVLQKTPAIQLMSSVCAITGLQLSKSFSLSAEELVVQYTMINPGDTELRYAPWEITRVGGGITFYRSDDPILDISSGSVIAEGGHVWHEYQPQLQQQNEKVFGNGSSGWLANAYNGLLLIKQFQPVPTADIAPGEAEVEIYGHGDEEQPYIEVEQQGRYQTIAPGEQVHWQVKWRLLTIPEELEVKVGNPQLLQLVEASLRDDEQE